MRPPSAKAKAAVRAMLSHIDSDPIHSRLLCVSVSASLSHLSIVAQGYLCDTYMQDTGRPWCCTPSLPLVVSSRTWCAHCRRCLPVGRMLTYWQHAHGPAPPVAAHRLTSLLCCQGIQAPSERPHALAWCLLFSEGMYAQVVEEPLACAPSWTV
jgi:hypothetical protein